jgi:hypothetical protein
MTDEAINCSSNQNNRKQKRTIFHAKMTHCVRRMWK